MSNDLDRECALALGWHELPGCPAPHRGDECIHDQIPNFSTGCRASRSLEDEIEKRGLWMRYTQALCLFIGVDEPYCVSDERTWLEFNEADMALLFRATPEARARAFLAAVSS